MLKSFISKHNRAASRRTCLRGLRQIKTTDETRLGLEIMAIASRGILFIQGANNKGADQTARMRTLICAIVFANGINKFSEDVAHISKHIIGFLFCDRRPLTSWCVVELHYQNLYKKTLMHSIKYASKIVYISVLFYWRNFEEQQAHGPNLLTLSTA